MKRVAILTFHRAHNYGAVFQAYALQEAISEKCDSYILDYRCNNIEKFYYRKPTIKSIVKQIIFPRLCQQSRERKRRYIEFSNKYFRLSDKYTSDNIKDANHEFDAFVAGSDQIWNPFITGYDLNYLLEVAKNGKANTYATSLGKARFVDWKEEFIKPLLKKINNISFREKTSVDMLNQYLPGLAPYTVIDPVYLLTRKQWMEKLGIDRKNKKKYIFMYFVAPQTNAIKKAKAIAEKKGWDILYVDALRYKDSQIVNINNAGPVEFLELLLNAELVITTSFHALSLSIIMNRPVLYELSKEIVNANSRLSDLAETLQLKEYEIKDTDSKYEISYNWDDINSRIETLRSDSRNKLFLSLELS